MRRCDYRAFPGWICAREHAHEGPCALRRPLGHALWLVRTYAGRVGAALLICAGLFICERCRYVLPVGRRTGIGLCRACYKAVIFRC